MGDSDINNTITTVESVVAGRRTSVCSRQEFHAQSSIISIYIPAGLSHWVTPLCVL